MSRARRAGALAGSLLLVAPLAACTTTEQQTVPHITVSGVPDDQHSVAPDKVLDARREAGIADCPASDLAATQKPDGLPALTLSCLGGDSRVNLAGLPTGKPYLLNTWAQWCQPCNAEAPYFAAVARKAKGRVVFLGLNTLDPAPGKVIAFATREGTLYPQLVDPKGSLRAPLRAPNIPTTILVDAQGRVVHREVGEITSAAQLEKLIGDELGVQL